MMKYLPTILWTLISMRGLYRWRKNATEMDKNIDALNSNGKKNRDAILFARAEKLMDNLRAFAFLNGFVLGVLSFFQIAGAAWTQTLTYLRVYADYTLVVLIGSFAIFALNAEIYGYVLDKVRKGRS